MDIKNRTVLVLGGGGMVGAAVCRKLIEERPKRIVITSILRKEAEETIGILRGEFSGLPKSYFAAWGGNIFVRDELRNTPRNEIVEVPTKRRKFIEDTLGEMTEEMVQAWCRDGAQEIDQSCASPGVQQVAEIRRDLGARLDRLHEVAALVYERWIEGLSR